MNLASGSSFNFKEIIFGKKRFINLYMDSITKRQMASRTLLFLTAILLLYGYKCNAQTDTINHTDKAGRKQGFWIVKNKEKKLPNYEPDAIIEEGKYVDNNKEGVWKTYYPSSKIKSEVTFAKGRPNGFAKIYYDNGCPQEEGTFRNTCWIGEYTCYVYKKDSCGIVSYHRTLNKPKPGAKILKQGPFMEIQFKPKTEAVIDTIKEKMVQNAGTAKLAKPFNNGSGFFALENLTGQISMEGTFKNYKLIDGKRYIYNNEGKLERIAVFKKGEYVGDVIIPGKK
jgi:antitoxin component YwqK of YwqJK toxin-antitoxin module